VVDLNATYMEWVKSPYVPISQKVIPLH
jgi:hypothetical protein